MSFSETKALILGIGHFCAHDIQRPARGRRYALRHTPHAKWRLQISEQTPPGSRWCGFNYLCVTTANLIDLMPLVLAQVRDVQENNFWNRFTVC